MISFKTYTCQLKKNNNIDSDKSSVNPKKFDMKYFREKCLQVSTSTIVGNFEMKRHGYF